MNKIVPAILEKDYIGISNTLDKINGITNYVQIDICDGRYVNSVTWPFTTDFSEVEKLHNLDIKFEFDLMVKDPENILESLIKINPKKIIIHLNSTDKLDDCINLINKNNIKVFIAVKISDNLENLEKFLHKIDGVQCMGIYEIGKQGEPYDKRVENVIENIRKKKNDINISVDGGITFESLKSLIKLNIQQACVGSFLLKSDDKLNTFNKLNSLINS